MKWWQIIILIIIWDCVRLILQAMVNKWWLKRRKDKQIKEKINKRMEN